MLYRLLIALAITLLVAIAGAVAAGVLAAAFPEIDRVGLGPAPLAAWFAALAAWILRGRMGQVDFADEFASSRTRPRRPVRIVLLIVAVAAAVTVFFAHDRIAGAFS